ncbi:MAG: hypothetical protein R3C49_17255 [Planctomycetaceae bacterium]
MTDPKKTNDQDSGRKIEKLLGVDSGSPGDIGGELLFDEYDDDNSDLNRLLGRPAASDAGDDDEIDFDTPRRDTSDHGSRGYSDDIDDDLILFDEDDEEEDERPQRAAAAAEAEAPARERSADSPSYRSVGSEEEEVVFSDDDDEDDDFDFGEDDDDPDEMDDDDDDDDDLDDDPDEMDDDDDLDDDDDDLSFDDDSLVFDDDDEPAFSVSRAHSTPSAARNESAERPSESKKPDSAGPGPKRGSDRRRDDGGVRDRPRNRTPVDDDAVWDELDEWVWEEEPKRGGRAAEVVDEIDEEVDEVAADVTARVMHPTAVMTKTGLRKNVVGVAEADGGTESLKVRRPKR